MFLFSFFNNSISNFKCRPSIFGKRRSSPRFICQVNTKHNLFTLGLKISIFGRWYFANYSSYFTPTPSPWAKQGRSQEYCFGSERREKNNGELWGSGELSQKKGLNIFCKNNDKLEKLEKSVPNFK